MLISMTKWRGRRQVSWKRTQKWQSRTIEDYIVQKRYVVFNIFQWEENFDFVHYMRTGKHHLNITFLKFSNLWTSDWSQRLCNPEGRRGVLCKLCQSEIFDLWISGTNATGLNLIAKTLSPSETLYTHRWVRAVMWQELYLELCVGKRREMIIDIRRKSDQPEPVDIRGKAIGRVVTCKYLGVRLTVGPSSAGSRTPTRFFRKPIRLFCLRKLNHFRLDMSYYKCSIPIVCQAFWPSVSHPEVGMSANTTKRPWTGWSQKQVRRCGRQKI